MVAVLGHQDRVLFSGDHLWWNPGQQMVVASQRYCWWNWAEQRPDPWSEATAPPQRHGSSSPQGRDQGVGAVTLGQVAPLKRLAIRLLPSL